MFTVHTLPKMAGIQSPMVRAAAEIEAIIQPHDAWSAAVIDDMLTQESVQLSLVTDAEGGVVGYCLYQIIFDQAEILRIGTAPQYQRQGIASRLFAALQDTLQAANVSSLLLEVRADNTAAIALYKRQGMQVIHQRKGYYQQSGVPAVDALIMQRHYE